LASIASIKLNEWLGSSSSPTGWLELFNTATQPVPLGGNYLTDLLSDKTKFLIPPLSYIGGNGNARWLRYIADNDNGVTAGHVNFSISPGEALGLFSGSGVQLDAVSVASQPLGISQGRFPDGTFTIVSMPPTPGAMNTVTLEDTDGDGIPDFWETAFGLNPNDPGDAVLDPDGDGQSNHAEFLAGTNPRNGSSIFAARAVSGPGSGPGAGQRSIRFIATAGKTYSVFYKNSLNDTTWTKLSDVPVQGTTGEIGVIDANLNGVEQRFYKVVTPQVP
jgi:hypothetical protein